ncbi:sulfite exporter TauE/SafE family protein [bacterium]|nr:sulfite exporter TauE/SafE family protein [bacterium]
MAHWYLIPPVFFVLSLLFAMLGLGGAQLYVPMLFWLGLKFKTEAIPLGLLLNMVTTSSAAFTYIKNRLVNWRIAIPMSVAMSVSAVGGAVVNSHAPTKVIVIIFAITTAGAAVMILLSRKPARTDFSSPAKFALCILSGLVFGFLAGLIGKAGGVFVVPLLYIFGIEPKIIAGTTAITVFFASLSGFFSHLAMASPRWDIWILCALSVLAGSQVGSRIMAKNIPARYIKIVFAGILLVISAKLIAQSFRL